MRSPAVKRLLARLRGEGGFTMIAVMGAMMAIMGLSAVALATASSDIEGNAYDRETKQAYAAAEAGLNNYLYLLNQDNALWAKCTNLPEPHAVNQKDANPLRWREVPGTDSEYAIELLPANGQPACDSSAAAQSMLDSGSGTFRIRTTGRVPTGEGNYATRTVITTFRRRGFLDYLYFTDFETSDPAWYELDARGRQTAPDLVGWASQNCARYWRDGRGSQAYDGWIYWFDNRWYPWSARCTRIQFAPGDLINGPLHTNDELLICGSPRFGRSSDDEIEVSAPEPGWRSSCAGSNPNFVGTFTPDSPILAMPPSNGKLKQIADPAYRFTGTTYITLTGSSMRVTNQTMGLANVTRALPPNGVIYVEDGVCGQGYQPLDPYNVPAGCGDVHLEGAYAADLTIAAEKDIVIRDDVTRTGDVVLGLIANNFVRVYHPVRNLDLDGGSVTCTNDGGPGSIRIDAAILALQHSFTVDHYFCGTPLGTLTVNGVIAQKFRGPVGRGGATIVNGYLKDYNYDDRLGLRQPPHFLDPVQSAWRVQRQSEQTTATP